jgi:hypothetical protein
MARTISTTQRFEAFAAMEATGSSETYVRLARAVAGDQQLIARLDELPRSKRQPNLLFATCRYLDAPIDTPDSTLGFLHERWADVRNLILDRWTQTNEAARCAAFVPILTGIPQPIALIEVGASAGLCLLPDRYRIVYDETIAYGPEDSTVRIDVHTMGPFPEGSSTIDIRSRIGIDRNPLDVRQPDDRRWLEACIWPEHTDRQQRLRAAADLVAEEPPEMVRGDLVETISGVLDSIPGDVTPIVFHSAVLNYLDPSSRLAFATQLRRHPRAVWISNEAPGVVASLGIDLTPPASASSRSYFILGIGGRSVAGISDPHGSWLRWSECPLDDQADEC